MIVFEIRDSKAVMIEDGRELYRCAICSRDSMIRYVQKVGADRFDFDSTDLGKSIYKTLKKLQKKNVVEKGTDTNSSVSPADEPPKSSIKHCDDNMVERTYVTDDGDSITIVHPNT